MNKRRCREPGGKQESRAKREISEEQKGEKEKRMEGRRGSWKRGDLDKSHGPGPK